MEDLIKALTLFLKYSKDRYPLHCEHDCLYVNVDPDLVLDDDKVKLTELGWSENEDGQGFIYYNFNRCNWIWFNR